MCFDCPSVEYYIYFLKGVQTFLKKIRIIAMHLAMKTFNDSKDLWFLLVLLPNP